MSFPFPFLGFMGKTESRQYNTEDRRQRRLFFLETVIAGVDVLDFTLDCARLHAEISAGLANFRNYLPKPTS